MADKNRPSYNRFGEKLGIKGRYELVSESYRNEKGKEDWHGIEYHGSVQGSEIDYYLPKGERILRYGDENGNYAAPVGTPYAMLAMPYKIRTLEYNEYEVVEEKKVRVIPVQNGIIPVKRGIVAVQPSWPDERGGGIQYYFPKEDLKSVLSYVDKGLRRLEVEEWSRVISEDIQHK